MFKKRGLAPSERRESRGFTLIELLVVVAIIGVLAGIIIINLNIARLKSRDAKRRADLASVQMAVETYADQNGGVYPLTFVKGGAVIFKNSTSLLTDPWVPNIVSNYISVLPKDPKNINLSFVYEYASDSFNYKLRATAMESPEGQKWATDDGGTDPIKYELFTAGAITW